MSPGTRTRTHRLRRGRGALASALATTLLLAIVVAVPAVRAQAGDDSDPGYEGSYSYLRSLDGSATLTQGDTGQRDAIEINQPILVGDRLWVAPRSRAEVVLSDGNLLRIDGDSEVGFEGLAASPDTADRGTVLRLREGNVQLVVVAGAAGDELPRVETANASIYLQSSGRYRITAAGGDWTEIVVRDGYAEVSTDRGSVAARPDEEVVVEGTSWPRTSLRAASAEDSLERWGSALEARLAADRLSYVDESLRYEAAPLADYGTWVDVSGSWAWRPRVATGWRPYWQGRWASTPAGLTWVSSEPWGWVPYHYGTWDYAPGYGWVWFPGNRFAPAWVYWYWGPSYTAWVPVGYYTRHYSPYYRSGFRFGVYGWAGGDWGLFADWVFCPTGYFGSRHQDRYLYNGRDWHRRHGSDRVPRGLITTDTRGITPGRWHNPEEVLTVLRTRPSAADRGERNRNARGTERELPDVTPFVARRDALPPEVRSRVMVVDDAAGRKLAGTPLAPAGLANPSKPTTVRATRTVGVARGRDGGDPAVPGRPVGTVGTATPSGRPGVVRARPRSGVDIERPATTARPAPRVVRPADAAPPVERGGADRPARVEVRPRTPARSGGSPAAERPVVVRPRTDGGAPSVASPRVRTPVPRPEYVRPDDRSATRPTTVRPPTARPAPAAPRAVPVRPRPEVARPQAPRSASPPAVRPPAGAGSAVGRAAPSAPSARGTVSRPAPSAPPRAAAPSRGSAGPAPKATARPSGGDRGAKARATRPRDRD